MSPTATFPRPSLAGESAFRRWQLTHDIHVAHIDLGIGAAWFAQQGDGEPVCGETEDEVCGKLARELGIKLWEGAR